MLPEPISRTHFSPSKLAPTSAPTRTIAPVSFEDVDQPQLRYFLNKIPTTFSLDDEQVDALIESGREVLRKNPVFQQLLSDMAEQ